MLRAVYAFSSLSDIMFKLHSITRKDMCVFRITTIWGCSSRWLRRRYTSGHFVAKCASIYSLLHQTKAQELLIILKVNKGGL